MTSNPFAEKLRELRLSRKKSLARLAVDVGCSAPKLFKLEHGQFTRLIPAHFLQQLCDALALTDAEVTQLFELAGYKAPPVDLEARVLHAVRETLQDPTFSRLSEELIAEVLNGVNRWRTTQRARQQKVRKVVIAAAGWQPRLLAGDRFERTLLPAMDEVMRAGVVEVLLVVPPNMPHLDSLHSTFTSSTIRPVVQREPLGLGNALLVAKEQIGHEPFAVLLADEIDESRTALHDVIKAYDDVHKPIVAVDTYEAGGDAKLLQYFGFAPLGEPMHKNLFLIRDALIEKPRDLPSSGYLRIAGRYVLTSEIWQALQSTGHGESGIVKHDLTSALNVFCGASASLLAYKLRHNMFSFAPYRSLFDSMDQHKVFDPATYRRTSKLPRDGEGE